MVLNTGPGLVKVTPDPGRLYYSSPSKYSKKHQKTVKKPAFYFEKVGVKESSPLQSYKL